MDLDFILTQQKASGGFEKPFDFVTQSILCFFKNMLAAGRGTLVEAQRAIRSHSGHSDRRCGGLDFRGESGKGRKLALWETGSVGLARHRASRGILSNLLCAPIRTFF